jgi:hypothetical protein
LRTVILYSYLTLTRCLLLGLGWPALLTGLARLEVLFDNFEKSATRSPGGAFSTGVNQITERVKHGRKLNMMIEMNDQSLRSTGGGGSTVNGVSLNGSAPQKHIMDPPTPFAEPLPDDAFGGTPDDAPEAISFEYCHPTSRKFLMVVG